MYIIDTAKNEKLLCDIIIQSKFWNLCKQIKFYVFLNTTLHDFLIDAVCTLHQIFTFYNENKKIIIIENDLKCIFGKIFVASKSNAISLCLFQGETILK